METDKKPRITQEKRTVESMIRLYCRKKEKNAYKENDNEKKRAGEKKNGKMNGGDKREK